MEIKVLCWNVEHFSGRLRDGPRADRVQRVADVIRDEAPDVFAIQEVTGRAVFEAFSRKLPGYSFTITEGPQTMEILVGVRAGLRSFITQRSEFKRNNPALRPGMLVTVTPEPGRNLPILFNHLKSMPDPEGFGLRTAMIERANGLWRALMRGPTEADPDAEVPFVIAGDLNLMGMHLSFSQAGVSQDEEIARTARRFERSGMRLLRKSHPATFNKGSGSSLGQSDLDHVIAARHMHFADQGDGAEVRVAGWAELDEVAAQDDWIARYSDHAPLIFTVTAF